MSEISLTIKNYKKLNKGIITFIVLASKEKEIYLELLNRRLGYIDYKLILEFIAEKYNTEFYIEINFRNHFTSLNYIKDKRQVSPKVIFLILLGLGNYKLAEDMKLKAILNSFYKRNQRAIKIKAIIPQYTIINDFVKLL